MGNAPVRVCVDCVFGCGTGRFFSFIALGLLLARSCRCSCSEHGTQEQFRAYFILGQLQFAGFVRHHFSPTILGVNMAVQRGNASNEPGDRLVKSRSSFGTAPRWFFIVMRRPSLAMILGTVLVVFGVFTIIPGSSSRLKASVSVLDYGLQPHGEGNPWSVRLGITNKSGPTIVYNWMNFTSNGLVTLESKEARRTNDLSTLFPESFPQIPQLLKRGAGAIARLDLPSDTIRWRVTFRVKPASAKSIWASRTPPLWLHYIYPVYERFLSSEEGPEQEITSEWFTVPHNDGSALDSATPFTWNAVSLWRGARKPDRWASMLIIIE